MKGSDKPKVIVLTGSESTGKSNLARLLARHYGCDYVPEYAREFLDSLNRTYDYDDILVIAQRQHQLIQQAIHEQRGRFVFCDTDLTVTRIWCEYKFGICHPWILDQHEKQDFSLYLLMDIDLPWQPDPQREHPDKRTELFKLYQQRLEKLNWPYEIVSGKNLNRFENAVRIIDERF